MSPRLIHIGHVYERTIDRRPWRAVVAARKVLARVAALERDHVIPKTLDFPNGIASHHAICDMHSRRVLVRSTGDTVATTREVLARVCSECDGVVTDLGDGPLRWRGWAAAAVERGRVGRSNSPDRATVASRQVGACVSFESNPSTRTP